MILQAIIGAKKGRFSEDIYNLTEGREIVYNPKTKQEEANVTMNIKDPQAFYQFLSQYGMTLISSKLTPSKDYKLKNN
mgnify:CR=1 FL=1